MVVVVKDFVKAEQLGRRNLEIGRRSGGEKLEEGEGGMMQK